MTGLRPRIVHARNLTAGTLCGLGSHGSGLFADTPGEVTCKNCLRVIEYSRAAELRSPAARWAALKAHLAKEIEHDTALRAVSTHPVDYALRVTVETYRRVLSMMDELETGQ